MRSDLTINEMNSPSSKRRLPVVIGATLGLVLLVGAPAAAATAGAGAATAAASATTVTQPGTTAASPATTVPATTVPVTTVPTTLPVTTVATTVPPATTTTVPGVTPTTGSTTATTTRRVIVIGIAADRGIPASETSANAQSGWIAFGILLAAAIGVGIGWLLRERHRQPATGSSQRPDT